MNTSDDEFLRLSVNQVTPEVAKFMRDTSNAGYASRDMAAVESHDPQGGLYSELPEA